MINIKEFKLQLPDGYVLVRDGKVQDGDIILNRGGQWLEVDAEIGSPIIIFTMVARPDKKMPAVESCPGVKADGEAKAFDVVAPLTDHAKYCRLSKQAGSLCDNRVGHNACLKSESGYQNQMQIDWTQCPRPEKQQPVELPKPDPLEELINKIAGSYAGYIRCAPSVFKELFREFAEKVRAL